jgi:ABC-2 type transport system permease protein
MHTDLTRLDLRLRRRGLWAYTIGMGAYAVLIVAIYPTFKDDASLESLASGNSSLAALLGISGSLTSPSGWMNANIYANFLPLVVLLMTIGYGASAVAGQDEDGALGLTATLPVRRSSLGAQKVAALVAIALPVSAVTLLAGLAGRRFEVTLETGPLVAATIGVTGLGVIFGLLALLIGALTGSRATALGVTSAVAVLSYVISALAPVVSWVHDIRWASPFFWSVGDGQITSGLGIASSFAMAATAAVLAAAAVWAVDRMDIH